MPQAAPTSDPFILERFLEMMSVERAAASATLKNYQADMKHLSNFLKEGGGNLVGAQSADLRAWIHQCAQRGLAPSTQARMISTYRNFYAFLLLENLRNDNPAEDLSSPKIPRPLPKVLSEKDVETLLKTAHAMEEKGDHALYKKRRLICLMEILYATGLRVSELVGLPLESLARDPRILFLVGKGGRERIVPLSEAARDAIADYKALRDQKLAKSFGSPWLFPSPNDSRKHLSRSRFAQILKDLALDAGLESASVHPHRLRHAFASHMLAHGADLRSVQQMLGHADISTTQIYTHLFEERLKKLVFDKHPLAHMTPEKLF